MVEIYRQQPDVTLREVGLRIGRSASTVSLYLKELRTRGLLPMDTQEELGR